MAFDLSKELAKLTGKVTETVTTKAKTSVISTLKDPEFKATINQFTKDWIDEHKFFLTAIFGGFVFLSLLAILNIISNFKVRR